MCVARPIPEILGELREALAEDAVVLCPEQALADASASLDLETVAHALATRCLTTVHELDATAQLCGRTTQSWLVEDRFLSKPEAGRRMKLVRCLGNLPLVKAAYESADITPDHASALVSALMSLPPAWWEPVEAPLVEVARLGLPTDVSVMVDDILTAMNVEKKSDVRLRRRNGALGFRLTRTMDGYWSPSGLLDPETGELLRAAIATENAKCGREDVRTPQRRDHDALRTIARRSLETGDQPSFTGSPLGVLVTIPADVLEDRLREAGLTLPSGMRISPDTARRLACDAEIVPAVLGSAGEVL